MFAKHPLPDQRGKWAKPLVNQVSSRMWRQKSFQVTEDLESPGTTKGDQGGPMGTRITDGASIYPLLATQVGSPAHKTYYLRIRMLLT